MNPFSFGKVTPENFCNREQELNELLNYVRNSINLFLLSRRREGKTALIYKLFDRIKEDKLHINTIYIDLFTTTTIEDFTTRLLSSYTKIESNIEKIKKAFSSFNPVISFDALTGQPTLSLDFNKSLIDGQLEEVFDKFEKRSNKEKTLFVFDEFQQIINYDNNSAILNKLQSIIKTQKNCSYIFLGSKTHTLKGLFSDINSPFRNIAITYELKPISSEHYIEWFNRIVPEKVDPSFIELIVNKTQGSPYFVQQFMYYAWEKKSFTSNAVYEIEEQLFFHNKEIYRAIWSMLTNTEQKLLKYISIIDSGYLSIKEISNTISITEKDAIKTLQNLKKRDLIFDDDLHKAFNDPLFRNWIIKEFVLKQNLFLEIESNWDVFISHASEDKDEVARPLASILSSNGLKVWYDEFSLKIGDSLNRKINEGLAKSKYGIVIISPAFLKKEWPQKELDGLVSRESKGLKVILPIWHNVTADIIEKYSPIIADRLAITTKASIKEIAEKITELIKNSA